jgi:hypothetical protein
MMPFSEEKRVAVNFVGADYEQGEHVWYLTGQLIFKILDDHGLHIEFDEEDSTVSYAERYDESGSFIQVKAGVTEGGEVMNDSVSEHLSVKEILDYWGNSPWANDTAADNYRSGAYI